MFVPKNFWYSFDINGHIKRIKEKLKSCHCNLRGLGCLIERWYGILLEEC